MKTAPATFAPAALQQAMLLSEAQLQQLQQGSEVVAAKTGLSPLLDLSRR